MEIRAKRNREKVTPSKGDIKKKLAESSQPKREENFIEETKFTHVFQVRLNALLYNAIQNMVTASHTAGDYTYTSVVDVIRAALEAHKNGMQITEQAQGGEKIQTTVRVHKDLYNYNQQLPKRLKSTIHEKAIRTFLKNL